MLTKRVVHVTHELLKEVVVREDATRNQLSLKKRLPEGTIVEQGPGSRLHQLRSEVTFVTKTWVTSEGPEVIKGRVAIFMVSKMVTKRGLHEANTFLLQSSNDEAGKKVLDGKLCGMVQVKKP